VADNLRKALSSPGNGGRACALMLDTKGPEIRTGKLRGGVDKVKLNEGDVFVWHHDAARINDGDEKEMYCTYSGLSTTLKPGSTILCSDALLSFTVQACDPATKRVTCRIENTGMLGNTKNMNLPNAKVSLPALTEKDLEDIKFGVSKDIDMIAASFIRKPSDVEEIRNVPGVREKRIAIVSKIENQEGLDNFEQILAVSDGIMVARGDLGSEIPIEDVAAAQKMMIKLCNKAGKPVITATQMLESMIQNPRPTRAEATDVANAVLDGSDAVMLSGETANGAWPIEAIQTMARICRAAEAQVDHREYFMKLRSGLVPPIPLPESIASTAVKTAWDLNAPLIVVVTETGSTARLVSKYRPHCAILTITDKPKTANVSILSRGTVPYLVEQMLNTEELTRKAIAVAQDAGLCKAGQMIPVVFGRREGVAGTINSLKIVTVQ
jgi:pyruvate kinase